MNKNKLNSSVVVRLPYDAFEHYVTERINYLEGEKLDLEDQIDEIELKIERIDNYLYDEYEILETMKAAYAPEKSGILGNFDEFIKRITG